MGTGADTFTLNDGTNVTISDFEAGPGVGDITDLSNVAALGDFAAVLASADDSQGYVEIDFDGSFDGSNVVELTGVASIADLNADDFTF